MDQQSDWESQPLCRHHLLAQFSILSVKVQGQGRSMFLPLHWAFGALEDGQCELMGVWPEPMSGTSAWQAIHSDLTARGVEHIRFVVMPRTAGLNVAFPGATVLNSLAPLLTMGERFARARYCGATIDAAAVPIRPGVAPAAGRAVPRALRSHTGGEGTAALSPRQRQVVARADEAARLIQARLGRALRRHGCFDSREAAVGFLAQALQRLARDSVAPSSLSARALASRFAGAPVVSGMRASGA